MDFTTLSEKEIESRFNQLIASTEATSGAPTHWFAVQNIEEKREILASIYRPGLTQRYVRPIPLSGGYTPYPPKDHTAEVMNDCDLRSMC